MFRPLGLDFIRAIRAIRVQEKKKTFRDFCDFLRPFGSKRAELERRVRFT